MSRLDGARLLLIDDQADLVENLREILEDEGAVVAVAGTLAAGLDVATDGPFDVALIDVRLPDGSGLTALPALREIAPLSEVVLITGHGSLDQAIQAIETGAYAYVLKPFNPDLLVQSVERAVRQVRTTRQRRALQRSLQQERDFISAVLDTAGALVLVMDRAGGVVRCNTACEDATGYTLEQAQGRPPWQALMPERAAEEDAAFRASLGAPFPQKRETEIVTRTGEQRVITWNNTALPGPTGEPAFVVWTGIDVTERRAAERRLMSAHEALKQAHERLREEQAKLLHAEKLSSIGQLSAGVAHEINNPLGGIMTCFEALRAGRVRADRRGEYEAVIADGLERIAATVRGLLDFARPRAATPEAIDVATVVGASLRLISPSMRRTRVEPDVQIEEGEVAVRADRSQLMQALVNVLLNATHASPVGSPVHVSVLERGDFVGVAVDDHGDGIPVEIRDKVCDPFFSTKPEGQGTGLGLSITQGILNAHGGSLALDDSPMGGARVVLWLPRAGAE